MDLEQHIKNLKDYIRIDKENINYDDSDFAQFCKEHCEDIQAVLNELENRIPRKDIEKELQELEVPILCWGGRGNGKNYARAVKEAKKYVLKKILNKE